MKASLIALGACCIAIPFALEAQHGGGASSASTPRAVRAPREASQYDFLIGQWELTVTPKVSGLAARIHGVPKLRGSWKAWRALDGWGIEDEMRIVDESGNPRSFAHSMRVYDPAAQQWQVVTVDAYRQKVSQATARWSGREMIGSGSGVDADGDAYTTRTRITRIDARSFRFQQDRSTDGGKIWEEAVLVIEAKRVSDAAPR